MSSKRPHVPIAVKLKAALLQLGLDPKTAELDHDPALELRMDVPLIDAKTGSIVGYRHDPEANDPRYLVWRSKADHSRKTNGPGGEKRITTRGGDHGDAAHLRAVTAKEADFRRRVLAKGTPPTVPVPPDGTARLSKRKLPSRPFPKRKPRA